MNFNATKSKVLNRGVPPDSFLSELVAWAKKAPDEIFDKNDTPIDIFTVILPTLGTHIDNDAKGEPIYAWDNFIHRKAAMLEAMRVLAGFESSWNWNDGRDVKNTPANSPPDEIETGAWQVSANSLSFGKDLRELSLQHGYPAGEPKSEQVTWFICAMKENHPFAMEYIARLLRHTTAHNGPVKRREINPWLRRAAVEEFKSLLTS